MQCYSSQGRTLGEAVSYLNYCVECFRVSTHLSSRCPWYPSWPLFWNTTYICSAKGGGYWTIWWSGDYTEPSENHHDITPNLTETVSSLVAIDYISEPRLIETIYFDKDLMANDDCFNLGIEQIESGHGVFSRDIVAVARDDKIDLRTWNIWGKAFDEESGRYITHMNRNAALHIAKWLWLGFVMIASNAWLAENI